MPKLVELYVKIGSDILLNFYITDLTFPIPWSQSYKIYFIKDSSYICINYYAKFSILTFIILNSINYILQCFSEILIKIMNNISM